LAIASAPLAIGTYRQGSKEASYCGKSADPAGLAPAAGLAPPRVSLQSDEEKRKQRVRESVSRLQEDPGHAMLLWVCGTAAWRPRLKSLVLRANSI